MKLLNIPFFALLCVLLSACRIEIDVPTSGSVTTTSGAIICPAGDTCSVDVADLFFDEEFVAQADEGFVFAGWKQKHLGLCGDKTTPCRWSTTGWEGTDDQMALLENQDAVLYLEPAFRSTGFNVLGIGHSFFRPFIDGMPNHATQAGIANHTQSKVTSGGTTGTPMGLWLQDEPGGKREQIQAILDGGDVDLFGMVYDPTVPATAAYENWFDYALSRNPDTKFFIGLPWPDFPEDYPDAASYASFWQPAHDGGWHDFIDILRALYPGVDIYCIPYGQSALELRNRFEAGNLPDASVLTGDAADAVFVDAKGHPGDILVDLGRLVWLNAIYGVDLSTYAHDPGYIADLKGIAQSIMDGHDPDYDAPYR